MKNPVDHPVNELVSARWSPYGFDAEKSVSSEVLASVFEAARWSNSANNAQPWRYIVANRDTDADLWNRVLCTLMEGNQAWARYVPVLSVGLIQTHFEYNGKLNSTAKHDLGAASAFLTLEATARGLAVHQMAGIHVDKIRDAFSLPETIVPVTALAIGYAGANAQLDPKYLKRDEKVRERKPVNEIILNGGF